MTNRDISTGIGRIVVGCMIFGLGPLLSTAQEVGPPSPQPTEASTTNVNGGGFSQQVHIDAHGNLSGQIEGLNGEATGQASAVNISFVQDGKVIASATSDGFGRFQVTGLQPGTYSVLAYGPDGVSAFSAQVLPSSTQVIPTAEGAPADSTTLAVDVVPTADANTLAQLGEDPNATSVTTAAGTIPSDTGVPPPAGGGGGGDAGALGAALGAAAAGAGIAAGGATGGGGGGAAATAVTPP